ARRPARLPHRERRSGRRAGYLPGGLPGARAARGRRQAGSAAPAGRLVARLPGAPPAGRAATGRPGPLSGDDTMRPMSFAFELLMRAVARLAPLLHSRTGRANPRVRHLTPLGYALRAYGLLYPNTR